MNTNINVSAKSHYYGGDPGGEAPGRKKLYPQIKSCHLREKNVHFEGGVLKGGGVLSETV